METAESSITDYLSKEELSILLDISQKVNSSLDLDEILDYALERLAEIVHAEASSIWLIDEPNQQLYVASATGQKSQLIKEVWMEMEEGIVGQVLKTGHPRLIPDVRKDPAHAKDIARKVDFEARTMLCVPMRSKDKVIGVIQMLNKANNELFDSKDELDISLFANLTGVAVENAQLYSSSQEENVHLRRELRTRRTLGFEDILGKSRKVQELKEIARRVAETDSNLLLLGESGTGKGMLAQAIHHASPRAQEPFMHVNCGAIPESLLESELFGHERGAFTGAIKTKEGRFELADGGTLFLDEVGDTPLILQVKLLQVLETKRFERVGGTRTLQADVRIIAATNQNLKQKIDEGQFREDLYYRLNVITIPFPPLRERSEDIPLLAEFFLKKYNMETNRKVKGFSPEAMDILTSYNWPGNVRELENAIEYSVVLTNHDIIEPNDLPVTVHTQDDAVEDYNGSLEVALKGFKRKYITQILQQNNGSRTEAAKQLGIQRTYLSRLIKELDIKA
ncbi:MAG: sigma 54-interacting transcriptional regulator [Deltaproteobacteria bacterium]|nr:sigma 54-interacting transcriptional regulator [Deltaproteobacteria bacterium]